MRNGLWPDSTLLEREMTMQRCPQSVDIGGQCSLPSPYVKNCFVFPLRCLLVISKEHAMCVLPVLVGIVLYTSSWILIFQESKMYYGCSFSLMWCVYSWQRHFKGQESEFGLFWWRNTQENETEGMSFLLPGILMNLHENSGKLTFPSKFPWHFEILICYFICF